jgi:GNAT superfamily N-acetyltransferase
MGERASVEIRGEPSDGAAATTLLAGFAAEIASLYPGWTPSVGPSAGPADFRPPGGNFLIAYIDGRPVACGGYKRLDQEAVEVKRIYVEPEARGKGLSRTMLEALEAAAREAGYTIARLDTGSEQPVAVRLFESTGYRAIPDYNDNPVAAYWFEKRLSPSSPASPRADSATV